MKHYYDPIIVQQYGGLESYKDMLADGLLDRPDAITAMRPQDIARYGGNVVLAAGSVAAGAMLAVLSVENFEDMGVIITGSASVLLLNFAYERLRSNQMIRKSYSELLEPRK